MDIVFDVEANGLLDTVDRIWCICCVNLTTGERITFHQQECNDVLGAAYVYLNQATRLIGHNICRYDLPALEKVTGWSFTGTVADTKVIARLIHPNVDVKDRENKEIPAHLRGKHSIEAWGYRLGVKKAHADYTDWKNYSPVIPERCAQDVEVNVSLWKFLRPDDYSPRAIELEHVVERTVSVMELHGVPFDTAKAGTLHIELVAKAEALERQLVEQFGTWAAPDAADENKRVITPKVNNKSRGITKGVPYCKVKYITFNPGSRQHIERVLRARGWQPTKFTETGRAEINEAVIDGVVAQYPDVAGLGEYLLIQKRLSQLVEGDQALLRCVAPDGRIHGAINPMGTTTSRAAHFHPNLGQVPSGRKPYGLEFRKLFAVPKGWVLVGADQAALENRCIGHYLHPYDGGAYSEVLLRGDPHWRTVQSLSLVPHGTERDKTNPTHTLYREGAKTFLYAFLYGAGPHKLGTILSNIRRSVGEPAIPNGLIKHHGEKARQQFLDGITGLEQLLKLLAKQVERFGAIKGLDGRVIPIRSEHSALNFLCQSAGAIVCKRWLADVYEACNAKYTVGWHGDVVPCLWVHDELQYACREGLEHEIGELLVRRARSAGEPYGFRIPLDSSYSYGSSWGDTH